MIIRTSYNKQEIRRLFKKHLIIGIILIILTLGSIFLFTVGIITVEIFIFALLSCLISFSINLAQPMSLLTLYKKNPKDVDIHIKNNIIIINESHIDIKFNIKNIESFKKYKIGNMYMYNKFFWLPYTGYINPVYFKLYETVLIRFNNSYFDKKEFVISDNENYDLYNYISKNIKLKDRREKINGS